MKKGLLIALAALFTVEALWAVDVQITVERVESKIYQSFKTYIYIDDKRALTLRNGQSGVINVAQGIHTMRANLSSLSTEKVIFSTDNSSRVFYVTVNGLNDFTIKTGTKASPPTQTTPQNGVEGSLERAAARIMMKIPKDSAIAIVYVTADDKELAQFIADELEFIMVDKGLYVVDRSQLDKIREEQYFQLSEEVDDDQAISFGKIAGADIIITGAVTGSEELRRLRLRALSTQTARVVAVASERY
jgi:hypothetical protein